MNVDIQDFDVMSSCGSFSKGNPLKVNPASILGSLQGFMEGYTEGLENSSDTTKQEQGKIFRQALMLLASPNGIALTTPEDIILNASQDIAESAQGSINLSAQKNIVGHAQEKVSLFAALKGFSAYAAKGPMKFQAQDDIIEVIAKKVIKLISTEDIIELISAKEIRLTAGGSQLKINGSGIFSKTGGKFESKAGQHSFVNGEIVNAELPKMPESGIYSRRFDFSSLFSEDILKSGLKYKIINNNKKTEWTGFLDSLGRTARVYSDNPDNIEVKILGHDSESEDELFAIKVDPDSENNNEIPDEECCNGGDHDHDEDLIEDSDDIESDFKNFGVK